MQSSREVVKEMIVHLKDALETNEKHIVWFLQGTVKEKKKNQIKKNCKWLFISYNNKNWPAYMNRCTVKSIGLYESTEKYG